MFLSKPQHLRLNYCAVAKQKIYRAKICKLQSQNSTFQVNKLVALIISVFILMNIFNFY